jgi:hypothetical protein
MHFYLHDKYTTLFFKRDGEKFGLDWIVVSSPSQLIPSRKECIKFNAKIYFQFSTPKSSVFCVVYLISMDVALFYVRSFWSLHWLIDGWPNICHIAMWLYEYTIMWGFIFLVNFILLYFMLFLTFFQKEITNYNMVTPF